MYVLFKTNLFNWFFCFCCENECKHLWKNLPKYDGDELIRYTVKEIDVPVGYTESYSDDTFTITNTYIPYVPDTGTKNNIELYGILALVGVVALIIIVRKKK